MKTKKSSLVMRALLLCVAVLIFAAEGSNAQVISNTGSTITVAGAVVNSLNLVNTSGTLVNHGTVSLEGYLFSGGFISGNGLYKLRGNWTNNGLFTADTSTVNLLGTVNQTIDNNSSGETFYNLILNNPAVVTQTSDPGGTLGVLNNLTQNTGTLNLHSSTVNLSVGGKATLNGLLVYNGTTTQTASIGGVLSGPGTIDMSGGNRSHVLNLAGSTNAIGVFLTSPSGASTVNYNGTNQTVFAAPNYRNLVISNSGIKVLQGNSHIGANLSVTGGTFDLGTVATVVGVTGTTSIAGALSFNGTTTKTVSLAGNLSGAGAINMSGGNRPHLLNLDGALNSIGSFTTSMSGSSTVDYRNGNQTLFISDNYRNLRISGGGVKSVYDDITASGVLTMVSGNIDVNDYTLKISNSAVAAIVRTTGTVIGKLQRAVGTTGSDYLYPLGTSTDYNPMKIRFLNLSGGPLTAQFIPEYIGVTGLPLDDDGNEIYDTFTDGYWSLTSVSPMATGDFNVNLNYDGFLGVDLSSSIIKRTNSGNLELDGEHGNVSAPEITRISLENGISIITTDLAIGRGRPRITNQPDNIDICEGSDAFFELDARGRGILTYQWQVKINSVAPFVNVSNVGVYSGATTDRLLISGAPYTMNGYVYQCVITDAQGNSNISNSVLLTVNKIPVAVASPYSQNVCTGVAFTDIVLGTSNDVTGTSFAWLFTKPTGISTTLPTTGVTYDKISGIFNNSLNNPVTVIIKIVPTGPGTTYCVGDTITVSVTVNPTPRVFAIPANVTQCDSTTTNIQLTSPSTFTSGSISFKYTVTTSGDITGFTTPATGFTNNHFITDQLVNHTDNYQTVTYRIVPVSPHGCADGPPTIATVTVNPTPRALPVNIKPAICFGGLTEIVLESPTVMTTGAIIFDYTVSVSGGAGIVSGVTTEESDLPENTKIIRTYTNSSDTLQSVYFAITPKVDNNICVPGNIFMSEVKVHPHPLQDLTLPKTLTCEGGSDAILRAHLAKGTSPFSIVWDGPFEYHRDYYTSKDTTEIKELIGGTYFVEITDNLGCKSFDDQYISGAKLDENYRVIQKVNGFGTTCPDPDANDGELWIRESVASTGVAPFEYWIVYNNQDTIINETFETINVYHKYDNLPAGSYQLYIMDANGCYNRNTQIQTIASPPVITVEFSKSEFAGGYNVSCRNEDDGSVKVESINGGNGGYSYQWSSATGVPLTVSTNTDLLDSIPAGKYYLVTTDMLGCMKTDSVTLTEPDGMQLVSSELSLSPDGNTNISCNGGNDGFIKMTISGGTGSYNYSWTNTANDFTASTEDIFDLRAGTYISSVTDENNCELKLMPGSILPAFTLTEPAPLVLSSISSISADGSYNINCNGGTGSIEILVGGGSVGTYQYDWSTEDGSGIIAGQKDQPHLTAGSYSLVITDLNGCSASKVMTLTEPPALELLLTPTDISCQSPGFNNGSIDLTVTGGVAPFSYSWSNGASVEDIENLTEGYYRVTVTYNNSCSVKDSVRINLPPPLTYTTKVSDYNGFNISCFGLTDGSVEVTTTSGLAPFTYSWTGPDGFTAASKDLSSLRAGEYVLLITDGNFCTATEIFEMTEPGRLGMNISVSESSAGGFNIGCAGDNSGFIGLEPLNGVGWVSYLWSDGIFGKTRMNIPAGQYTVVLTDENNCQASETIVLTEPDSLKIVFDVTPPFCPDMPDGQIRVSVTGGVPGTEYSYRWSDNSSGGTVTDILKGIYKVIVTDMNSCSVTDSVRIEPLNETCLIIPNAISPNDDLINDFWNIGMIELYPDIEIRVFNRWGETVWRSEKGYPRPWDGRSNGVLLPIDSYHYIIDLHNGTKPLIGNITIVR